MAVLSPVAKQQFFTDAGLPAAGYKLYTYAANTTTPQATYTNAAGTSANANPIVLDSQGRATIFLDPTQTYDFVLKTAADVPVWTQEDVSSPTGEAGNFIQSGTGAVPRTMQDKARDTVSIKDFGAVGDGVTDDTVAIQAALNSGARTVRIPVGEYLISDTLRQPDVNEFGQNIIGENKLKSILKAATGMDKPMLWIGKANGGFAQYSKVENFTIQGAGDHWSTVVSGNDGLVLKASHVVYVKGLWIHGCDKSIVCPGTEGGSIDDCYIASCNYAVYLFRTTLATPLDEYDYTRTGGQTWPPNAMRIQNNWITSCVSSIYATQAELLIVRNNVFQSGAVDQPNSVILLDSCNSSYTYGGGPIIENNWFEGTTGWVAAVRVKDTNMVTVRGNLIFGTSVLAGSDKEGGIIATGSDNLRIENNSIALFFGATPSEGRTVNAPIYVAADCLNYIVSGNYCVRSQSGDPYFAGDFGPSYAKDFSTPTVAGLFQGGGTVGGAAAGSLVVGDNYKIATVGDTDWVAIGAASNTVGVEFVATGAGSGTGTATRTPKVINGRQISSFARSSLGVYSCVHSGIIGNMADPTTNVPFVTVVGTVACFASVYSQTVSATNIRFYDAAGALVDPDRFSLLRYGRPVAWT